MKAFRIEITSWTSSFRFPNLISGYQPTLEAPPVSAVLGLINSAAGKYLHHQSLRIGYFFKYEYKTVDLETIYMIEGKDKPTNNAKSNVIKREFFFNNFLYIYLIDEQIVEYFRKPHFQLLLGRSTDLASVKDIVQIELQEVQSATKIKGQVVPFRGNYLQGQIQALPKYFTDAIPRENVGTEPYSVISCTERDFEAAIPAFRDKSLLNGIDIYFHELRDL